MTLRITWTCDVCGLCVDGERDREAHVYRPDAWEADPDRCHECRNAEADAIAAARDQSRAERMALRATRGKP